MEEGCLEVVVAASGLVKLHAKDVRLAYPELTRLSYPEELACNLKGS
jgi:hypothetical protein